MSYNNENDKQKYTCSHGYIIHIERKKPDPAYCVLLISLI